MFGMEKEGLEAAAAIVLLPASPYSSASGISPIPTLSSTIKKTRFIYFPLFSFTGIRRRKAPPYLFHIYKYITGCFCCH